MSANANASSTTTQESFEQGMDRLRALADMANHVRHEVGLLLPYVIGSDKREVEQMIKSLKRMEDHAVRVMD